ncbi:MAG: hypothetical protein J0H42_33360 [Rhizobiales bacterium]|nr:hypothetical protein [Hyphomicrobiales bacterium]
MAKKTDHRADGLGTDNTGGVLSGLLAEEDELDRRALWRLGSWGVGAVAAVVVAVMANQTQLGWKRDQMAAADLGQRAQQMQNIANQTEREARRLAAAIDTLNSDRDRLYTRVTSLEHGLDSVTGSIARQNSAAASPAQPAPAAEPQAAQHPAPAVAPVTTQTAAAAPDKPAPNPATSEPGPTVVSSAAKDPLKDSARETAKTDVPKNEGKKSETAKSGTGKSEAAKSEAAKVEAGKVEAARIEAAATAKTDSAKTEATKADAGKAEVPSPATPLVASKSFMAPPDPSASKLIEPAAPLTSSPVTASPIPEVMAAAPATDAEADEETGPKVAIQRTQFGVDVGTANSVPGLRALWRGLLKSRSNAPLAGLRPIIVIKESTNGLGMQLRLVAGPLNDAGAAAKICAVLIENKRSCETAIFDGQRLSLTGDDPAPAPRAKPSSRHRSVAKRAVVAEEAPKKPEPAAPTTPISSWFGKRGQ